MAAPGSGSMDSVLEGRMFEPASQCRAATFFSFPRAFFHHTRAYRVTKAQKAQILAVIEPDKGRWIRWGARSALALASASGVAVDRAARASLWESFLVSISVFAPPRLSARG